MAKTCKTCKVPLGEYEDFAGQCPECSGAKAAQEILTALPEKHLGTEQVKALIELVMNAYVRRNLEWCWEHAPALARKVLELQHENDRLKRENERLKIRHSGSGEYSFRGADLEAETGERKPR